MLIDKQTELANGRYALRSRLGTGGAATVWLADDTVLERKVAVKVLSEALASDESWLARFRREARIAAMLTHPNLVSVYDFASGPERPYIVMEYMPGGSLHDVAEAGEQLDSEMLTRDLLSALSAIHAGGIIHRDVKPGNVLLSADGTACLTDFGIARPEDATSLTQTGQIPGTAEFMAPELWRGEAADERSDLYGAGVVLRRLIGEGSTPELARLIDRLSAEDRENRPASAKEALESLGGEPQPSAIPVSAEASTEPAPRTVIIRSDDRPKRVAALAGVAVLAIIAVVALAQAVGGGDDAASGGGASNAAADGSGQEDSGQADNTPSGQSGSGSGAGGQAPAETTADPAALNQQGFDLIQAGEPADAVPILRRAVNAYPADSTELEYAYALYNFGNALYLSGRAEQAIPVLEKRLTFDNQTSTVQATLDEARAAAGGQSSDDGEDDD